MLCGPDHDLRGAKDDEDEEEDKELEEVPNENVEQLMGGVRQGQRQLLNCIPTEKMRDFRKHHLQSPTRYFG